MRKIIGLGLAAMLAACQSAPISSADIAAAKVSYDRPGPHEVTEEAEIAGCVVFRPTTLGSGKYPVILWGNGTRSKVPAYSPMLKQWASHGFVVAANVTNSAGPGKPLLDCLDHVAKESTRDGAVLKGHVDLTKVGASGHSQGGGGAIMAARDLRITTTAPIQPYIRGLGYEKGAEGKQHGPMLLLTGGADTTAGGDTDQKPVFEATNSPVVWATVVGSPHSDPATATNGLYRPVTTAWFLWQLKGDQKAAAMFNGAACAYCTDAAFTIQKKGVD